MNHSTDGKRLKSFRLTAEAVTLLDRLARQLGLPRSGILELLIRDRAQADGLKIDGREPWQPFRR